VRWPCFTSALDGFAGHGPEFNGQCGSQFWAETLEGLKDADGKAVVHGIFAAVPYCVDLIGGPYMETKGEVCKAFRPKTAIQPAR